MGDSQRQAGTGREKAGTLGVLRMYQDVTKQAAQAMEELLAAAKLERGDLW